MFKLRARKRTLGNLLAIGVLAAATVLVSPTAPTAQAAVPCPTAPGPAGIDGWVADYAAYGVTLCIGYDGEVQRAMVQIIDLTSGARLAVGSKANTLAANPADNTFPRLSMSSWEGDQRVMAPNSDPFPDFQEAFSVTNASFFTSTTTTSTKLSLPFRNGRVSPANRGESYGVAIYNTDPNSATPKKVLRMDSSGSNVQIASFPTIYNSSDAQCVGWYSCVVGFDPFSDPSGDATTANFRTFVGVNAVHGVNATRAFILTGGNLTVAEADDVLGHFGAVVTMQLDGGGSTAMRSYMSDFGGALGREVPNVLVVKYSPVA